MSKEETHLKDSFENELDKIKSETVLSPAYRRKKTIIWAIRTTLAILLIIYFWEHSWAKWALIIYIPLSLISLLFIYGSNTFLKRKINKTRSTIQEAERLGEDE